MTLPHCLTLRDLGGAHDYACSSTLCVSETRVKLSTRLCPNTSVTFFFAMKNCSRGFPLTADHSIIHASTSTLDPILCHDSCDVDVRNRQNGDTPLHIAVRQKWEDNEGLRLFLGEYGFQYLVRRHLEFLIGRYATDLVSFPQCKVSWKLEQIQSEPSRPRPRILHS